MQAPTIIHFKSNQDKIMHKSCSFHLQPKKNDRRIVLPRAKSIALLRLKMQIFKNKLSFNILVACYYIASSVDIKERETVEHCQIYFITKLKYNLRKLNTEGLVRSSLVINCCNTAVECLHGCSIKKTFSHGYFENGNYRTFFIRKIEPHEI